LGIFITHWLAKEYSEGGSECTIPDKRLTTLLADWERPEAAEELRPEADAMVELATVEDC
jgi:hypothetical protein